MDFVSEEDDSAVNGGHCHDDFCHEYLCVFGGLMLIGGIADPWTGDGTAWYEQNT